MDQKKGLVENSRSAQVYQEGHGALVGGTSKEEGGEDLAKEELNLLAKLIGTETNVKARETFRLNLFEAETMEDNLNEEKRLMEVEDATVNIDLKIRTQRGELDEIIKEMTVNVEETEDDDILSLMDKAS